MKLNLEHSAEWHANRLTGIGGSDAKRIMAGDWHALWMEKTGRAEGDDLSNILPVQMGSFTEPFNLAWFERQTGWTVSTDNREQRHPYYECMRCEIDGWANGNPVEAKHINQNTSEERLISNYYPQLQHQLVITNKDVVYLSALFGNVRWAYFEVARDDDYIATLIERETAFWKHVTEDTPPVDPEAEVVNIALDDMREVDMQGNNEWAMNAGAWVDHEEGKRTFDAATRGIKELIEADVKMAHGHGIIARKSKSGAITIRKEKT
jgi:predicted phage-related endonuclease